MKMATFEELVSLAARLRSTLRNQEHWAAEVDHILTMEGPDDPGPTAADVEPAPATRRRSSGKRGKAGKKR